jgi:hypothetical protein
MSKAKIIFFWGGEGGVNSSDAFPRLHHFLVLHPSYTNEAKTLIMTSMTLKLTHITRIHFSGEYKKITILHA